MQNTSPLFNGSPILLCGWVAGGAGIWGGLWGAVEFVGVAGGMGSSCLRPFGALRAGVGVWLTLYWGMIGSSWLIYRHAFNQNYNSRML